MTRKMLRLLAVALLLAGGRARAQISPGGQTVTDGTHTVTNATTAAFTSGCVVGAGGFGTADVTCSGTGALQPANCAISYGADPTGATDSTTAINACLASTQYGVVRNAYLPAGVYKVSNSITIGTNGSVNQSQCLIGDGAATTLEVGINFNATANGVLILTGTAPTTGDNDAVLITRPCIQHLQVYFQQPSDGQVTAASTTAAGGTQLTLNSVGNMGTGDYAVDISRAGALSLQPNLQVNSTTITAISGNTITISPAVLTGGTVVAGDTIAFSPARAAFTALGSCSLTAGSAACKYPYAIYGLGMGTPFIDDVLVQGGYNCAYLHGTGSNTSTYSVGRLECNVLNSGLDSDDIHNFSRITSYMLYDWGLLGQGNNGGQAFSQNYYDDNVICFNLGAQDDIEITSAQCWTGSGTLNANWSFGHFGNLAMDGKDAVLIIKGTTAQWTQIDSMYSTGPFPGQPGILMESGNVQISNLWIQTSSLDSTTPVQVTGGRLSIVNGTILQNNTAAGIGTISGGEFRLMNSNILTPASAFSAALFTSSAGTVQLTGDEFQGGGSGTVSALTDISTNLVQSNNFAGWTWTPPGTAGSYQGGVVSGSALTVSGAATIESGQTAELVITANATTDIFTNEATASGVGWTLADGNGTNLTISEGTNGAQANHPALNSNTTGNPVILSAAGSDAAIGLKIAAKGTSEILLNNHVSVNGGGTPTAATCEGTGSVSGNDTIMKVTGGSTTSTTCTIDFGNAWASAPVCLVTDSTGAGVLGAISWVTTSGSIVVTSATTDTAAVYMIHCVNTA